MFTVTQKVYFVTRGRRKRMTDQPAPALPQARIPRISRLMALAIRFDKLICDGEVLDQSELARLAQVTQPRVTQIMNLLHLSPDIQEKLLFLPPVADGRDPIHERMLRPVCAQSDWSRQRKKWGELQRLLVANTPDHVSQRASGQSL